MGAHPALTQKVKTFRKSGKIKGRHLLDVGLRSSTNVPAEKCSNKQPLCCDINTDWRAEDSSQWGRALSFPALSFILSFYFMCREASRR